ncbi:MAG TPA: winged helix-turn-helix domain-containing protein [Allocoleopsis sp.]
MVEAGTIHNRIIDLLKSKDEDITINDIAKSLKIDRHTAAKHLEVLKSKGIIEYRTIGKSKVWKISKNPFINSISSSEKNPVVDNFKNILLNIDDKVNIQTHNLKTIWTNKIHSRDTCYESIGLKSKCKNCPIEKTFKSKKSESGIIVVNNKKIKILTQPIIDGNNEVVAVVEIVKNNSNNKN